MGITCFFSEVVSRKRTRCIDLLPVGFGYVRWSAYRMRRDSRAVSCRVRMDCLKVYDRGISIGIVIHGKFIMLILRKHVGGSIAVMVCVLIPCGIGFARPQLMLE